ncbi:cutinase-domain-containing protein [Cercophora newfieldiana]|uniref:Cutinase-domain-containing protein n=1 Tax=Cercophora newfieldiana TaxID=92897 RepID=A0AA39XXS1_9PEZI|nr:cutinase-domain-containing protein [Cercophora newfieldiana]
MKVQIGLALATGANALFFPFARRAEEACATGLHMIVVRGSNEEPGMGKIGVIAGNVSLAIPGSTSVGVEYPAAIDKYASSLAEGTTELVRLVGEYEKQCPGGKIALLGYSQGAHSVMDAVCGSSSAGFRTTSDLPDAYESSIVAIATYGDPSHTVNASWNQGTSMTSGIFPRLNLTACEPYTDRIRSWCDVGDVYCDKGNNTRVHGTYFANYTDVTVDFIVGKYNESIAETTPAPTPTPGAAGPGSAAGLRSAGAPDVVMMALVSLGLLVFGSVGLL